jgi:Flp pilus assembly protein TadD
MPNPGVPLVSSIAPIFRAACLAAATSLCASLLTSCSACDSRTAPHTSPSSSSGHPAATPASASAAPSAPERRSLPERRPLDERKLLEKRSDVIAGLNAARDLLAKNDAKGALALLAPIRAMDPLGGALALTFARAALAAGDASLALRAANQAVTAARGRADLVASAGIVVGGALEKLSRPRDAIDAYQAAMSQGREQSVAKRAIQRLRKLGVEEVSGAARPSVDVHADGVEQACKVIESQVRSGKVELPSSSAADLAELDCAIDMTLDVDAPALRHAYALRVDAGGAGGSDRLIWVALEGAQGLQLFGPVVSVFGTKASGVLNDVVVDLQKIDVLPGGAPEVVTKIVERRTLPDVALDEVTELEETRAILLTIDRGGILPSREVVLSSRIYRARIDPKAKPMPRGFAMAQGGGQVAEYAMKVAWGGPNSITLTKVSGDAKPKLEGDLQLFP